MFCSQETLVQWQVVQPQVVTQTTVLNYQKCLRAASPIRQAALVWLCNKLSNYWVTNIGAQTQEKQSNLSYRWHQARPLCCHILPAVSPASSLDEVFGSSCHLMCWHHCLLSLYYGFSVLAGIDPEFDQVGFPSWIVSGGETFSVMMYKT